MTTATEATSDRGLYARPLTPDCRPDPHGPTAGGRTVLLVVPGTLLYLTPAEALHLAGQLRGAVEHARAECEGG